MPDTNNVPNKPTQTNTTVSRKPSTSTTTNQAKEEVKEENKEEEKKTSEPEPEPEPEPTLEEDYEALKNMHLLRNVMIRMQYGRYPNKKIDGILKRRMDLDESQYQGTHIIRIIISIMAMFFICMFAYFVVWLFASSFNFADLKETASLVISLFFLCSCGFAIFNNISVPNEKKLKEGIKTRMEELEKELKEEKAKNGNQKNNKK